MLISDQQTSKPIATCAGQTEIRVKGQNVMVPSADVFGRTVISIGRWLKVAAIHDEELQEGETISNPVRFIERLRETGLEADLFTFIQKLPHTEVKYSYHLELENFAVIPIATYAEWWDKRVESSVRRAVRKAAKSGVVVKEADFNDRFIQGIVNINNETPIRQGKPFWHYQKSFEAVKHENSTYADRNIFLGAYEQDELIGYLRITCVDTVAHILQILSMVKHFDKRLANAMIAKAVEVAAEKGFSQLTYCSYIYNDPDSSLTEFKRRNGFEQVFVPRYYVPLTLKGSIALKLGIHRGFLQRLPKPLLIRMVRLRNSWYERKTKI